MALDINSIVVGKNYGVMSKGVKTKVEAVKVSKRAGTVDVKGPNGRVITVPVGKLMGLQGRPPASAGAAQTAKAPAPKASAPKAPAAKPAAAPKAAAKNTPAYADLLERLTDVQNRIADAINEQADIIEALNQMEPAEPAAPAKGKAQNKPMADAEDEAGEDEIEFD